jgi:hypothetical protein
MLVLKHRTLKETFTPAMLREQDLDPGSCVTWYLSGENAVYSQEGHRRVEGVIVS